jgi:hypothetical protein
MTKFTWNDTVQIKQSAPAQYCRGEPASVVGISLKSDRRGAFLEAFPEGIVYTIEFEGGSSVEIHESFVEKGAFPSEIL